MRRKTLAVEVGTVTIGNGNPVVVQSMTSTDTADVRATVRQIIELAEAGSELVRVTVDRDESAAAVPHILEKVRKMTSVPVIGDFHFNGHLLLTKYPEAARLLDKYRINPGNVGRGEKRDRNFETFIGLALKYQKPVRIGVNGGSLDPELLGENMDKNRDKGFLKSDAEVFEATMVESALVSAAAAQKLGLPKDRIILSAKLSEVPALVRVHESLAAQTDLPIHLGLTEAGGGISGAVSSAAALSVLLYQGIGDTIRVSITPQRGETRTKEVEVAREILQALELRTFTPKITSCPGCGRTTGNAFQVFAEEIKTEIDQRKALWEKQYPDAKKLRIAVMGCVVNGPGEARAADVGIFFPGKGEGKLATVFIDGAKAADLSGAAIKERFLAMVEEYLKARSSKGTPS